jgi:capsular polysaccharide biosynthesis protein
VDAAPSRESELVELTRDYATLQATYASLLTKREDSKLAANLERRQIGEQFKVLDPASLPERPVNAMMRVIVLVGGSLGGLVLGLLGAAVLEYRDSSYRTEADVTTVLSLPVLALIPLMESEAGGQPVTTEKRASRFASAVAVALAVGAAAASLALGGGQL